MKDTLLYDDKTLFSQIADGQEPAFRIFFDRYKTKLYYFILNITKTSAEAEELVQDVFLRLWVSRQALAEVVNPGAYLFVMGRNRALDHIKKEAGDKVMKAHFSRQNGDTNFTEEQLELKESRRLLEEGIRKLPSQQQKVYRLSREGGLSREDIAAQLNISPNTVKNHLADALSAIRRYMKDKNRIILFLLLTPIVGN